ncbi:MAG: hypothetical protein K1X54_13395 [Flavobacteriales bacterium]|nr:hypothetical protein [Flavobacteriales bacterium]
MVKRIIQIAVIVACLSLIIYVYFQFSGMEKTQVDPIEAIPGNVSFAMEITSFENLHPYMELLDKMCSDPQELGGIPFNPVAEWGVLLHQIDSLRQNSQPWFQLLNSGSVYFCSSQQNRGDSWIISIGLLKGSSEQIGKDLMQHWGNAGEERQYEGISITKMKDMYFSVIHDCLVLASSPSLMEDVIIRNEQGDLLRKDETFGEAHRVMSDDQPMHFLMMPDDYSWMEFDPMPTDDASDLMFLSGYCIFTDSSHHNFRLTEKGGALGIASHLPSNTAILDAFCYESFETGWDKHEQSNANINAYKYWSQAWKSLGDSCACDLNESMLSWRTGEWGTVVIEVNDSTTAELLYYGVKDSLNAVHYLQPLLHTEPSSTDNIYNCRYPQLFERNQILPIPIEANYITQSGQYLFAANTPGALQLVMTLGDTLAKNPQFKKTIEARQHNSGRFIYQTKNYTSPLPQPMIRALSAFPYFMTEVETVKDEHVLIKVGIPFRPNSWSDANDTPSENNEAEEIASAQSKVVAGPFQVTNHNTGGKETFLQYENMEVALIDGDGKELWKKNVGAKILGDVVQIDALKNNKLQIAFATEDGIHILDRNGDELGGFPVNSAQALTSPLHVADYDGTKKYRLLVATENNQIKNINVNGKDTEGWKYSGNTITMFIDDFKIGNDDFLMTVSSTGKLAFYKRTGELRYETSTVLTDYNGESCEVKPASTIQDVMITYTTQKGESKTVKVGN